MVFFDQNPSKTMAGDQAEKSEGYEYIEQYGNFQKGPRCHRVLMSICLLLVFLMYCGEPENTVAGTADGQATNEFEAKRLALSLKSSQVPVQILAKIPKVRTRSPDLISNMKLQ